MNRLRNRLSLSPATGTLRLFAFLSLFLAPLVPRASDWPTYRFDARRSGYTAEKLPPALSLRWTWSSPGEPDPAWQGPDTRMGFDRAFEPVVVSGILLFGSSADCTVYALDAETREIRWTFLTQAPVRFAPAAWRDRLFVVSDDGFLYCLGIKDGKLFWRRRGGASESMVLGNDRMISRWPARGGPVLIDDTLYWAAGIWPSEGIYLYALDPETGETKWCNDKSGSIYMPQPHGTAEAESGVSAQGYLVGAGDFLLVPTGRAVPAAFTRADGALKYFHLQRYGQYGGADIVSCDTCFVNGGHLYDTRTGLLLHRGIGKCVVTPEFLVAATPAEFRFYDRKNLIKTQAAFDRRGKKTTRRVLSEPLSRVPHPLGEITSLAAASHTLIVGTRGRVHLFEIPSGKPAASFKVEGTPFGLAVSRGCLYVSTDWGKIHCFGPPRSANPPVPAVQAVKAPPLEPAFEVAAREIIKKTKVREGFCLDIACGDGSLAYALAERTNFRIYAVEKDPRLRERAVRRLKAGGLYGKRVTVHDSRSALSAYPDYFADLVVAGRSVTGAAVDLSPWRRCLRPFGGTACIGRPGELKVTRRGPLAGAGVWTHQYADPGNTGCSKDRLARRPLCVLWFRDRDFPMPSRHGRGPAPLFLEGRLFVEGLNGIRCIDAYNGRTIWEYPLPGVLKPYDQEHLMGTAGTGSNICLGPSALYVRREGECLQIDQRTGRLLRTFKAPREPSGKPGTWGFIACTGKRLFGTLSDTTHIVKWRFIKGDMSRLFTESLLFFALDLETGGILWRYKPHDSIRNNAIALGGGRVYLIDRPKAEADRIDFAAVRRGKKVKVEPQPPGVLVAFDQKDGQLLWKNPEDIFGTVLIASEENDILLMAYQDTRFKLDSEVGGRMCAFRASTGRRLWDIKIKYQSRPVVNGRTVYAQPWALDLLTGRKLDGFALKRSYGCGIVAGSCNLLVFRSATFGYVDLLGEPRTENYGGIRPGCWINAIPVGGLVLMPDASARCVCSYLNSASIALTPCAPGLPR